MKTILMISFICISFTFANAQPGTLDKSFGNKGIAATAINLYSQDNEAGASNMLQLKDGGFLVAVSSTYFLNSVMNHLYFYKLNSNGTIDSSFGDSGRVRIFADKIAVSIVAMAIDAQSRIVVTIEASEQQNITIIARFTPAGIPDSSFAHNGVFQLANNNYVVGPEEHALKILPNGKILAGYTWRNNNSTKYGGILMQFTSKGTLDKTFAGKGYVIYTSSTTAIIYGNSYNSLDPLVIQQDGKILFTYRDIVRYNADGSRDMSFGINGKITPVIQDGYADRLSNVTALQDGRFMACGSLETKTSITNNVYRFTKNGIPDSSFGTNGIINIYSGGAGNNAPMAGLLNIQPDNKFLLSFVRNTAGNEFITRYLPGGNVDSSFANNGVIKVATMGYNTFITSDMLLQQQDNKLVTLGSTADFFTTDTGYFYLNRYKNDVGAFTNKQPYADELTVKKNILITLSPNPAVSNVTIGGLPTGKRSDITVINRAGNTISAYTTSSVQYNLNVSRFMPGMYYVIIKQDGIIVDKKQFMKQ